MADIYDSVSGTNQDDDFINRLLDSQEFNQGDHGPFFCPIPEGTDWDRLHHSQPVNTDHEWPAAAVAASEGNADDELIRNHQQETFNVIPQIGMVFASEEEAYNFYKNYATQNGFSVRKGKTQRSNGEIRNRYFFCSKEGHRLKKQSDKKTKYKRKETRTGCKARILLTIDNKVWKITRFIPEHNHAIEGPDQRHITSTSTKVPMEVAKGHSIDEAGMVEEAGVANATGFHFGDCNNYSSMEKTDVLPSEVCQSLIDFLSCRQLDDPSFFHRVQLDSQSRVKNFFWREGRSKKDYEYFGDVLILDTTFRIEKYEVICAPFLGLNHHQQYVLFGCGFLLDDSRDSFGWLVRTFLEAMSKRQPKTIFTDECQATSDAIKVALPQSQHRLGLWYIFKNARKHLSQLYTQPDFSDLFDKCICHCNSKEQFFSLWESLFEKYNLRENSWLNNLYRNREKWSHIFGKITFSAGIESSQDCEYVTSIFSNTVNETVTPLKFVQQYLKVAEKWRIEEEHEDFHCDEDKQAMVLRNCPLEKQAREAYTCKMFKLLQEELLGCLSLAIEQMADDGRIITFKLTEEGHEDKTVEFNCLETQVTCSCKKFETIGILCVHALKVLNAKNIFHIPSQHILKRWTKSAKRGMMVDDNKQEFTRLKRKASYVVNKSVAVDKKRIVENYQEMAPREAESVSRTEMTQHVYGNVAEFRYKDVEKELSKHKKGFGIAEEDESMRGTERNSCYDAISSDYNQVIKENQAGHDQESRARSCSPHCSELMAAVQHFLPQDGERRASQSSSSTKSDTPLPRAAFNPSGAGESS